jgi:putative secretion ATPase (PEP-CTERM system associated)
MYKKHFSFNQKPFELIPNPDFLFMSEAHKKAITYLDYGIKEKIGFILLTGEIGSGKTTIVRNMIKNLNGDVRLSKVNNTKVSSEQLISMINEDFGLDVIGKDKTTLLSELNDFLIDLYAKGFQSVLLIDEAQNLNPDLLEEIRLLSNLETDRTKLLQIILVGQPELKKTLSLPRMRQLRQRINLSYHIPSLTYEETGQYIKHRLTIAGNPDAIPVNNKMLEVIYGFSRGIPRLINILCDFLLLTTFVEGEKEVKIETVKEIAKELSANDYWNEKGELMSTVSITEKLVDNKIDLSYKIDDEITEALKMRLIKLEEAVSKIIKNVSMDMKAISERLSKIEEEIFSTSSFREKNKINELATRVSKLERMPVVTKVDTTPPSLEFSEEKSLVEQVEFLKRMLNYINTKLKKL